MINKNIPEAHKKFLKNEIDKIYKEHKQFIERINAGISKPIKSMEDKYIKKIEEDITKLFKNDKYINIYKITRP